MLQKVNALYSCKIKRYLSVLYDRICQLMAMANNSRNALSVQVGTMNRIQ